MAVFPQGLTHIDQRCTAGERRVLHRLQRCLEDDYLVWHDIPLGPKVRQPDFVILSPSACNRARAFASRTRPPGLVRAGSARAVDSGRVPGGQYMALLIDEAQSLLQGDGTPCDDDELPLVQPATAGRRGAQAFRRFDWGAPSVKLITLHSAKGLEFPLVFVAGLQALPWRGEPPEDAVRLLYVAMTRATRELVLSAHGSSAVVQRPKQALATVAQQFSAAV